MLRLLLISSIISGVALFYRPVSVRELPSVYPVAKISLTTSGKPSRAGRSPFNGIVIERERAKYFIRPDGRSVTLDPDRLYSVPFLGTGFFEYEKIGSTITFRGRDGEILWTKNYNSYPVPDYTGRLILLLTGDNNRVDLINSNGNPAGDLFVAGNFLSDFDFSTRRGVALLTFAGGKIYILDDSAKKIAHYDFANPEMEIFLKSCAISPDGNEIAIHYYENGRDYISVLQRREMEPEVTPLMKIELPAVYPHLLHMGVTERGGLLVAAPDFTVFYDDSGESVWSHTVKESDIYRPVLSDDGIIAYLEGGRIRVSDSSGNRVAAFPVNGAGESIQIMPGGERGELVVISSENITVYRYQPIDTDS
jgi:hypothetical protein